MKLYVVRGPGGERIEMWGVDSEHARREALDMMEWKRGRATLAICSSECGFVAVHTCPTHRDEAWQTRGRGRPVQR